MSNTRVPTTRHPITSHRLTMLLALSALMAWTGCNFEGQDLEDRRCINDAACVAEFGAGFVCRQVLNDEEGGYCEESPCTSDAQCEDAFFCTTEVCDPDDDDANSFGCVISARDIDDGIDCTEDVCDEENDVTIHDITACECSAANDPRCALMFDDPCVEAACDLATFTCTSTPRNNGDACDDGAACSSGTLCLNGLCVVADDNARSVSDANCDDGQFCTDAACDPASDGADNFGCVITTIDIDDGIACTADACDPDAQTIVHDPAACECAGDEDCLTPGVETGCVVRACQDDFSCGDTELRRLNEGSPCDDGFSCTRNDTCNALGQCAGTPVDALCGDDTRCTALEGTPTDDDGCAQ